jgi:hypothetical protein
VDARSPIADRGGIAAWITVNIDKRVLIVTLIVSLLAGSVSALVPALHVIRPALIEILREGGRSSSSGRAAGNLRNTMVVAEITLAVVLLSGAALLIRGLYLCNPKQGLRCPKCLYFPCCLGLEALHFASSNCPLL